MQAGAVSVEIECQDEENTFHTTYKVQKYPQYARRLENAIRSCFSQEGIRHSILLNQNPPKGYEPYQSVKNWWVKKREPDSKVRYPRLGSFEVLLRCPPGFAGRVPPVLWVWSKLHSHKWPDPDRLANDLLRLLVSGQQDEDVSDLVHKLSNSCNPIQAAESLHMTSTRPSSSSRMGSRSANPPMFFSLSPRQRVPTPVEIRSPPGKHRDHRRVELPPRPMSATSPSRPRPDPPQRQRPSSAVGLSSATQSVGQWITGGQSVAEKLESPASSVGHAAVSSGPSRHLQEEPPPVQNSWGADEDPFETDLRNSGAMPSSAWGSTPPAQVVAEPPAQVSAEPLAQPAAHLQAEVVAQPAAQVQVGQPLSYAPAEPAAQPLAQVSPAPPAQVVAQPQAVVAAEPVAQAPTWATAVAPAPPAAAPAAAAQSATAPAAAAPAAAAPPAAALPAVAPPAAALQQASTLPTVDTSSAVPVKPGGDYDDYADDFEDDPGSPAAARTPTTHAGDNTVLTMTDTSAISAEPPQAVITQPVAAPASASSFSPPPDPTTVGQAVDVQPALASAVASAAASASAATARAEASRELPAEEVEEYDDEGFEEDDAPSPAQPPIKSDGTASTATRGSNADGEQEDPDVYEEEGFEGDDDVEEDVPEDAILSSNLNGNDRIVVEGQSYDYAEDNEFEEEFSDMSREVSIDDAHSVKTADD